MKTAASAAVDLSFEGDSNYSVSGLVSATPMCPRLFSIGGFSIPTYGVLLALGLLVGLKIAGRLAERSRLDPEKVANLGVSIAIAAIVGAKLFMIADNWSYYSADFSRLFSLSALRAGGVFYGGLLAALIVAVVYAKKTGLPWLLTADALAPGAAIGHSIGRLGCFAAGCCWGRESDVPWAVVFTNTAAHEFTGVPLGVHMHPTQLYEACGTALIGFYLLRAFRRPHAPGSILGRYLLFYSAFRFCVEFFREEGARTILVGGVISTTQLVAVALVVFGAYIWLTASRNETVTV